MDHIERILLLQSLRRSMRYEKYSQLGLKYLEPLRREIEEKLRKKAVSAESETRK